MRILGIETSCDETAASVVEDGVRILSNVVASSEDLHKKTGGIVPEVAAREQIRCIIPVIKETLGELRRTSTYRHSSNLQDRIDTIAVTVGPGLIGSLLVGTETAKVFSYVWQKPLLPVNHLIGHIYGNFISEAPSSKSKAGQTELRFPAVVLIVSGGHTELVLMRDHGDFEWLGGTRDDAAGEAFDKVAKMLGLGYPGGPEIERVSKVGNPDAFNLPRPLMENEGFDFSFSGLKTAVMKEIRKNLSPDPPTSTFPLQISNLAASFQQAVVDVLVGKTIRAAQKYQVRSILLAGGVAANNLLRETLRKETQKIRELEMSFHCPPIKFCTDNAAYVASAAYFNFSKWRLNPQDAKDLKKIFSLIPLPSLNPTQTY